MKKIFIFAAIAAAFMACTKDVDVNTQNPDGNIVRTVTVTASHEGAPEAKAILGEPDANNKMAFRWLKDDQVIVYYGKTEAETKTYKALATKSTVSEADHGKSSASLEVSFLETETPDEGSDMLFFYPAGKGDAVNSSKGVSFTFPAEQSAAQKALPKDNKGNQLSAAIAQVNSALDLYNGNISNVQFKNAFAVVRFAFDETLTTVKKVTLVGNAGEILSGTYDIAGDASIALSGTGYKEVTVAASQFANVDTDGNPVYYYMVIPPTKFTEGFTVKLTLADGTVLVKSSPSAEFNFARSSVNDLGTFSANGFKSGISSVNSVWSKHNSAWYSEFNATCGDIRNIAMDDEYVYLVQAGGPGVFAVKLSDGTYVKSLSTTGMANGTHLTSDANVIDSESGSKLLVCNLALGQGGILKVYSYDSIDSTPVEKLKYTLPADWRFGDHFTIEGTWENGRLLFYDYKQTGKVAVFTITNGAIASSPEFITMGTVPSGNIGSMYKYPYNDTEYLWAGAIDRMRVYSLSGASAAQTYQVTDGEKFSKDIHGVCFFTMSEKKYMAHVGLYDDRNSGRLNIGELTGETLESSMKTLSNQWTFYLAGDNISAKGASNGNAAGDGAMRVIDGKVYIAANVPGSGVRVVVVE